MKQPYIESKKKFGKPLALFSYLITLTTAVLCFLVINSLKSDEAEAYPPGIMPSREVKAGMRGYGLSVFKGTVIEQFPVVIEGKLDSAIGEADMIIVRITGGYTVRNRTGIIAGMSGSPVYINGRLIGAIGYGWSFTDESIGGVTPIEKMLETMPSPKKSSEPVSLNKGSGREYRLDTPIYAGGKDYRRIVVQDTAGDKKTIPEGTMVLSPVPSVFQVHGFSPSAMKIIKDKLEPYGIMPVSIPGGYSSSMGINHTIKPGSAVGVTFMEGDLSMAGTGTVTYRSGDTILAFGHPMIQLGTTSVPFNAANIEGIVPSLMRPFKLSSSMGIVGTLEEDRLYAVGGTLGKKPHMIPLSIEVEDTGRNWQKRFNMKVMNQKYLTPWIMAVAGFESCSSSAVVLSDSSASIDYKIKFKGYPEIEFKDVVAGRDVQMDLYMQLREYLSPLIFTDLDAPQIERMSMNIRVYPEDTTYTIRDISTQYARVRPGDNLEVKVRMTNKKNENLVKTMMIPIPGDIDKGQVRIGICSARNIKALQRKMQTLRLEPTNVSQLLNQLRKKERNNQLIAEVVLPRKTIEYSGEILYNMPASKVSILGSTPSSFVGVRPDVYRGTMDLPYNIEGHGMLQLQVSDKVPSSPDGDGFDDSDALPAEGSDQDSPDGDAPDNDPGENIRKNTMRYQMNRILANNMKPVALNKAPEKPKPSKTVLPTGSFLASVASANDYFLGNFKQTSITNGNVTLGRILEQVYETDEPFVMSMIYDRGEDSILAAESPGGLIKRIVPGQEPETVGNTGELMVPCMVGDSSGVIYMGTGPNGNIFKKAPGEELKLFCTLPEEIVWDLKTTASGDLLAATGARGKVYKIDSLGRKTVLFESFDSHITALELLEDGTLFIGCSNEGAVYRMEPGGGISQYYKTLDNSIDDILYHDKSLWIASDRLLYNVDDNKQPKVYVFPEEAVIKLAVGKDKSILAATSNLGRIYKVFPEGDYENLFESDINQVTDIVSDENGGIVIATGNPGRIIKVQDKYSKSGQFLTDVIDAEKMATFGRVQWMAETPGDSEISFQSRTGNTPRPDKSWSDWSPPYTVEDGQTIMSPPARYAQLRANLSTEDSEITPMLYEIQLYYHHQNMAPLLNFESPQGGEKWSGEVEIAWKGYVADPARLCFSLFYSGDSGEKWEPIEANINATLQAQNNDGKKKNSKSPSEKFKWQTSSLEEGKYLIKLVGFDKSRPEDSNLTSEIISKPVVITNKKPEITLISSDGDRKQAQVVGFVKTYLANVKEVKYRINNDPWAVALPQDGTYDNTRERFIIYLNSPYEKNFKLRVKATDEAGNSEEIEKKVRIDVKKESKSENQDENGKNNGKNDKEKQDEDKKGE